MYNPYTDWLSESTRPYAERLMESVQAKLDESEGGHAGLLTFSYDIARNSLCLHVIVTWDDPSQNLGNDLNGSIRIVPGSEPMWVWSYGRDAEGRTMWPDTVPSV